MAQQDVEELILAPMRRTFLTPRHLQAEPETIKVKALAEYVDALERFDRNTLTEAWRKVRREHPLSIWPPPGDFERAAELFQPRPLPPSPEVQKREQARQMAETYTTRYLKTSKVARQARREGWQPWLRSYIEACAWVQAQWLSGLEGISWDSVILSRHARFDSSQQALAQYHQSVAAALEEGTIRVTVSPERIEEWKAKAREAPGQQNSRQR